MFHKTWELQQSLSQTRHIRVMLYSYYRFCGYHEADAGIQVSPQTKSRKSGLFVAAYGFRETKNGRQVSISSLVVHPVTAGSFFWFREMKNGPRVSISSLVVHPVTDGSFFWWVVASKQLHHAPFSCVEICARTRICLVKQSFDLPVVTAHQNTGEIPSRVNRVVVTYTDKCASRVQASKLRSPAALKQFFAVSCDFVRTEWFSDSSFLPSGDHLHFFAGRNSIAQQPWLATGSKSINCEIIHSKSYWTLFSW